MPRAALEQHARRGREQADKASLAGQRAAAPAVKTMLAPVLAALRSASTPAALRAAVKRLATGGPPPSLAAALERTLIASYAAGDASGRAEH